MLRQVCAPCRPKFLREVEDPQVQFIDKVVVFACNLGTMPRLVPELSLSLFVLADISMIEQFGDKEYGMGETKNELVNTLGEIAAPGTKACLEVTSAGGVAVFARHFTEAFWKNSTFYVACCSHLEIRCISSLRPRV